jgi:protein-S-isoprenylcysteine O-methyltransferase Ste14
MKVLSGTLVTLLGVLLTAFAVLIAIKPKLAEQFLRSFASSPRAHYSEQLLRLIAGGALVSFAPWMWHPDLFRVLGWLIVATALVLLLLPWRWHNTFGTWAIPLVIRYMKLYAVGASALAILIFYGVSRVLQP